MAPATAERFHKGQMRTLRWLALNAEHLGWFANYIDEFTDPEYYPASCGRSSASGRARRG